MQFLIIKRVWVWPTQAPPRINYLYAIILENWIACVNALILIDLYKKKTTVKNGNVSKSLLKHLFVSYGLSICVVSSNMSKRSLDILPFILRSFE